MIKVNSRLTLGSHVATQSHGDCTCCKFGQATQHNDLGVAQCRKTCTQGERNGQSIRETKDGIGDDTGVDAGPRAATVASTVVVTDASAECIIRALGLEVLVGVAAAEGLVIICTSQERLV